MSPDPPTGAPPSAAPFRRTPSPKNLDLRQWSVLTGTTLRAWFLQIET